MTDGTKLVKYQQLARKCEENKHTKRCKNLNCAECPLFLPAYMQDQQEACLIQTCVALDYNQERAAAIGGAIAKFIIFVFWAAAILFSVTAVRACLNPPEDEAVDPVPYFTMAQIQQARIDVEAVICDVNNDDKINCQDYAMIFCLLVPHSKIILNNNARTNFNHLFNAVKINTGAIVYIEPQYTTTGIYMTDIWPEQYREDYNVEVTWLYKQNLNIVLMFEGDYSLDREVQRVMEQCLYIYDKRINEKWDGFRPWR